ncbi:MAG: LamG domain-containing protein, partial [Chloroflexi bacterium]|nr:LamG domain-containing protein [Chloroflexota bacterium]
GPHITANALPLNTWTHIIFGYENHSPTQPDTEVTFNGNNKDSWVDYNGQPLPNLRIGNGRIGQDMQGNNPFHGSIDEIVVYDEFLGNNAGPYYEPNQVRDGEYYLNTSSPSIADRIPLILFTFEDYFTNTYTLFTDSIGNNDITCDGEATCPNITDQGYQNESIVFDGTNEYLRTSGAFENFRLHNIMWVNVNNLPASGQRAYLLDSSDMADPGYPNIYLDDGGHIVVAFKNASGVYETAVSTYSFAGNLDQWTKLQFMYYSNGSNLDPVLIEVEINNVEDAISGAEIGAAYEPKLGGSILGNSVDGNSPFDGMIDNYSVTDYQTTMVLNSVNFDVDGYESPNIQYINVANDATVGNCQFTYTCPSVEASGRYGAALAFDGRDDYIAFNTVDFAQGDYTIGSWFKTTTNEQQDLLTAVTESANEHGIILEINNGIIRYLHRFPTGVSGGTNIYSSATYNDNDWHYATAVREGTTITLYIDSVVVGTGTSVETATEPLDVTLGRLSADDDSYSYEGVLDELVIIPAAVSSEGVDMLMNSVYPAIDIPALFETFSVASQSIIEVSGSAAVSPYALSGKHQFSQEVEAALALQTTIDYPVVDSNSANLTLFLPFEDVPGTTLFDNLVDSNNRGVCSNADACPTAGLRGQVGRAAYFDGINDVIKMESSSTVDSVSVWIKADRGTIFDTRGGTHDSGLQLDVNQFQEISNSSNQLTYRTIPIDLPENEWVHLVATYDDNNNRGYVYINGIQVASGSFRDNDSGVVTIGANTSGADHLHGFLDDLRLYNTYLSASDVQTLYEESAPLMRFEFDEDGDATAFIDNSVNGYVGLPSSETYFDVTLQQDVTKINPIPGTDGQIGNTALFDGDGYIEVLEATAVNNIVTTLTAMAWIKPSDLTGDKIIVSSSANNNTFGFSFGVSDDELWYSASSGIVYNSGPALDSDVWQHVAVTVQFPYSPRFYVDGVEVSGGTLLPDPILPNALNSLYIGARTHSSGTPDMLFTGQIDELAVYGRELTAGELYSIYLRELRWYRDRY